MTKTLNQETSNNNQKPAGLALPDFVLSASSLSKTLIENDRGPSKSEIMLLRKRIASALEVSLVHLAEFPKEQEAVMNYLEASRRSLSSNGAEISIDKFLKSEENLNRAVILSNTIYTVKRLVNWVVFTFIFYFALVVALQYFVYRNNTFALLDIPGLVLAWACLGGITAILFRHRSIMEKRWPLDLRWLWIVLRPFLGMIMGSFMYLAIVSGLLLFGASALGDTPQKQILLAMAFVAGFSDRIWEFLIRSVLGPYSDETNSKKRSETNI